MKKTARLILTGLFAVLAFGLVSGCETVNTLAEVGTAVGVASGKLTEDQAAGINRSTRAVTKTFEDITPEQEYYIGRTVAANILATYKAYPATALNEYVNEVGQALSKFSTRPDTFSGYRFLVLDSNDINAFAAPGGLILVTRGLLKCCTNEDELAAVLAHEIGHVEKMHGLRAIRTSRLNSALTVLALESAKNLGGAELAELAKTFDDSVNDIVGTMMNSGYSRRLEYEADAAAVLMLRQSGYAPAALISMLQNMQKNWNAKRHDFAATHPPPADRIAEVRRLGVSGTVPIHSVRQQRFTAAVKAL